MTEPIPADEVSNALPTSEPEPENLEQARKLRSEARNLRERLHAAEAANDALRADHEGAIARLAALEHAEVERIAAEHLIDASDVWRQQPDIQGYYDEEFSQIVPDKVREAAAALASEKPHLARPNTAPPPSDRPIEGLRGGSAPEPKKTATSWASALRGTGL